MKMTKEKILSEEEFAGALEGMTAEEVWRASQMRTWTKLATKHSTKPGVNFERRIEIEMRMGKEIILGRAKEGDRDALDFMERCWGVKYWEVEGEVMIGEKIRGGYNNGRAKRV